MNPGEAVQEIDVAALGPLERIAGGGQGLVYRQRDAPDGPVYKEYLPRVVDDLDVTALRAFVRFAAELDDDDRGALLGRVAWPEVVVRRDGVVRGFLMRQVPPEFRTELRFAGTRSEELATAQFLLNPQEYLDKVGLRVTERFQVEFLADTAAALALLHRLDIAVGDLSPNNLLFSLTTQPRCFFVDSDSMRLGEHSVLPQGETPDWRVGDLGDEELGTEASDVYKFGLLTARLFAGDQHTTDPARIPVRLRRHVKWCLATDPGRRPGAAELLEPLGRALARVRDTPPPDQRSEPIPEQRGARQPRPAPAATRSWGGGAIAFVFGALALVGIVVAGVFNDSGGGGTTTGGVGALPQISSIPYPYPTFDTYPTYNVPLPTYSFPDLVPVPPAPLLVCLADTSSGSGVAGGPGLESARDAVGSLCTTSAADQWPSLRPHTPYSAVTIVGFFGEGTASPTATVDLTSEDSRCWRTKVGFDAGYRVLSVGPLSACG
ncbi:protein kinase family protein [Actinophytocola sediminis]